MYLQTIDFQPILIDSDPDEWKVYTSVIGRDSMVNFNIKSYVLASLEDYLAKHK